MKLEGCVSCWLDDVLIGCLVSWLIGCLVDRSVVLLSFRKRNVFYRVGGQTTGNALNLKTPFSTKRVH